MCPQSFSKERKPLKPSTIAPAALALGLSLLTGCKSSAQAQFDPCTVQPTRIATPADEGYPDVWVEGDGEKIDNDPCDSDDFVRDAWGHLTPVRKPEFKTPATPKTTPGKVTPTKAGTPTRKKTT